MKRKTHNTKTKKKKHLKIQYLKSLSKKFRRVKKIKISRKSKKIFINKKTKRSKQKPLALRISKKKGANIAKIKVVGVGGGGGNVISRMFDYFPRGVDLMAINTDLQDLENCQAKKKIYIGKEITKGLGAGMNPELGRQAAEENRDEIIKAFEGTDMIFLTAGLGGGTGSGAMPVIAEIAQELGILTVAVVTKPFSFEGGQRTQIALDALAKLRDRVDSLIAISNDRIFSLIDKDTSMNKAFEEIDEVLKNAVLGVTELIISPGIINVDFADIRAIIQGSGSSIIGVGQSSGKERAIVAANMALNSPLLETSIDGAKGVLFSVSGLKDVKMSEINDIARLISENVDPNAKIIFGTYYDRRLSKGEIKVTLIATGFGLSFGRNSSLFSDFDIFSKNVSIVASSDKVPLQEVKQARLEKIDEIKESEDNEDDVWEIPAFLRKKGRRK
ncbi:MAG: cell division protein FtsZ [Candidatus Paceibacterota bacterium]